MQQPKANWFTTRYISMNLYSRRDSNSHKCLHPKCSRSTNYRTTICNKKISHKPFLDLCEMSFWYFVGFLPFLLVLQFGLSLFIFWWHTHTLKSELFPKTVATRLACNCGEGNICMQCHHNFSNVLKYLCKLNFKKNGCSLLNGLNYKLELLWSCLPFATLTGFEPVIQTAYSACDSFTSKV